MKIFYRKSWWRSALALLLIMCMVSTMLVATSEESHALTLTGLACSVAVGLTIGALLGSSGVPMNQENSVSLINAFYWGCDAEQLAIIESFSPGQAIGDLFDAVSGFFTTYLNTGNIFYSRSLDSSVIFPRVSVSVNSYGTWIRFLNASGEPVSSYTPGEYISFWGLPVTWKNLTQSGSDTYGLPYITFLDGTEFCLWPSGMPCYTFSPMTGYYPYSFYQLEDGSYAFHCSGRDTTYRSYDSYITISPDDSRFPAGTWDYINMVLANSVTASGNVGVVTPISEYLPTSTDTEKALVTTTPVYVPQTWEQLWDSTPQNIREGTFTGGEVVNPDLPTVGETSGTISGEGAGTGVFEGVGSWLLDLPVLGDILGALKGLWETVKDLLATVGAIATSVSVLASGDVPAELEMKINEFSGQLFDLLSFNELSQSMEALQNFESGYGEPPKITVNLHSLADTAQRFGKFENEFADSESVLIDFEILEDTRFGFMGLPLIEWIRLLSMISMVWYTAWYVWDKVVPRNAIE